MRIIAASTLALLVAVAGCTVVDFGPDTQDGPITGGLVSTPPSPSNQKIVVSVTGASLGALLSSQAKKTLNKRDREKIDNAAERSFRDGERVEWRNDKTGRKGAIQPGKPYRTTSGDLCRDFTNTIRYQDREDIVTGTACKNENGSWQIVN